LTALCNFLNKLNKFEKVTLQPEVGTSAPPSARALVRNRIFGAKPDEKKVRNHQNNFRTSASTENYFHSNGNNVSF